MPEHRAAEEELFPRAPRDSHHLRLHLRPTTLHVYAPDRPDRPPPLPNTGEIQRRKGKPYRKEKKKLQYIIFSDGCGLGVKGDFGMRNENGFLMKR